MRQEINTFIRFSRFSYPDSVRVCILASTHRVLSELGTRASADTYKENKEFSAVINAVQFSSIYA